MPIVDFDTATWNGSFRKFSPEAKLMLVYLFTNDSKNLAGIYKVGLDVIGFYTGLSEKKVKSCLKELENEILYDFEREIVWVISHTRKQFCRNATVSPKIIKGIENVLTSLHGHYFVGLYLEEYGFLKLFASADYIYPIDTPPVGDERVQVKGVRCISILNSKSTKEGGVWGDRYSEGFNAFWAVYPDARGKDKAWESWRKREKAGTLPVTEAIVEAVKNQIRWRQMAQPNEFRPAWKNPTTWINQGCWDDKVDITPAPMISKKADATVRMLEGMELEQ
jgi:hypothetical protein